MDTSVSRRGVAATVWIVLLFASSSAAAFTVTGQVKNQGGTGLPGVEMNWVSPDGDEYATTTNGAGNYSIDVPAEEYIVDLY